MSKLYKLAPHVTAQWDVHSGAPCIQGRRISTAHIAGQFASGREIQELADDFRSPVEHIEAAIRYEFNRRVKRKPEFRANKPDGSK